MTQKKGGIPANVKPLTGNVRFEYIKSNAFRVIHVDGVHGGVQPNGRMIHMSLFNERHAIPKSEEYEVKNGQLGKRIKLEGRSGIVREVEVATMMDLNVARAMRGWLDKMIVGLEATEKAMKKKEGLH